MLVNRNVLRVCGLNEDMATQGVWLPNPQSMTFAVQDLDYEEGTGRNQQGYLFRDRVATKRKLTCVFPPMEAPTAKILLENITDVFFRLEYPDLQTNTRTTIVAYVGDRTSPYYYYNSAEGKWLVESVSVNFIER